MSKIACFLILIFCFLTTQAQSKRFVLTQIIQAFNGLSEFEVKVNGKVESTSEGSTTQEVFTAYLIYTNEQYYAKYLGYEVFMEDSLIMIVDHSGQSVVLQGVDPKVWEQSIRQELQTAFSIDDWFEEIDTSYFSITNEENAYVIQTVTDENWSEEAEVFQLYINKRSFLIEKVVHIYGSERSGGQRKMMADYKIIPHPKKELLPSQRLRTVLNQQSGRWQLKGRLENYQLTIQTPSN